MSNSTVHALTAASALDGTEEFYAVQGGHDRKVTATQIATFVSGLDAVASINAVITSAQILSASASPVEVIPAPGAGKAILLLACSSSMGGSIDYTVTAHFTLIYGTTYAGAAHPLQDEIEHQAGFVMINLLLVDADYVKASLENKSICFSTGAADATGGNGDLKVAIIYSIIDV